MNAPRSWPMASLAVRLKRVNDTIDKLRQLAKRWDNRLVLEDFPLTEHYLNGRIAIALIVEISGSSGVGFSAFTDDGSISTCNADDTINSSSHDWRRLLFLILPDADNDVVGNRNGGNEHAMLIHSVKHVEGVETRIAPSLVRFYGISDYKREIGRDSLYKSVTTGSYETLPRALKREIGDFSDSFRLVFNDLSGDEIKGCTKIVDRITNDRGNDLGETAWPRYQDLVTFASGSAILIGASSINVLPSEGAKPCFKLVDVLVGPFDL